MVQKIDDLFYSLSRTKKVEFIDQNIDYASAGVIAKYINSYLYDVLKDVKNKDMIADYLRENGYKVELMDEGAEK